jgi:hypothetical protein
MSFFGKTKPRERERYYLLPGMGGKRAVWRKKKVMLLWALGVGILASAIVALLLPLLHANPN